ncbi:hypothetical protein AAG906_012700 [Vitis piasezkii]
MQSIPTYKGGSSHGFIAYLLTHVGNLWTYPKLCGTILVLARHKRNISTLQNIKMQDNESLREFVKRFGQAVLQVEACSMDAVLQIFKRSICPGTPFFESLAKSLLQRWMTCSACQQIFNARG